MDRIHRMSRGRKTLLSLLLVGALGRRGRHRHVLRVLGDDRERRQHVRRRDRRDLRQRREQRDVQHRGCRNPATSSSVASSVTYTGSLPSTVALYALARRRDRTVRGPQRGEGHRHGRLPGLHRLHARRATRSSAGRSGLRHWPLELRQRRLHQPWRTECVEHWQRLLVYRFTLTLQDDDCGDRAVSRVLAQLHVGGAERLDASDPGGPLSGPPGPPREAPVQLFPGPGSSRSKESRAAPSKSREG